MKKYVDFWDVLFWITVTATIVTCLTGLIVFIDGLISGYGFFYNLEMLPSKWTTTILGSSITALTGCVMIGFHEFVKSYKNR